MSDETTPTADPTETTPTADPTAAARAARNRPGLLSHASDHALRPGFRNPPTKKSAARQKAKKSK